MFSDFGVCLRRVNVPKSAMNTIQYAHQDDYYIIGMVESGHGYGVIDFKEHCFSEGDVFLVQPGQVHQSVRLEKAEGWMLFVDSGFVGDAEKRVFDNFSLFASSFKIDKCRRDELEQVASILAGRVDCVADEQAKAVVRRLTETFLAIVAEALREIGLQQARHSRRHVELVLSFRRLLAVHLPTSRKPSYYASLLNISPVYLNEVVKDVTGMNVTSYIKAELVLQAKRLLVHTDLAVKEIADRLGVDDYAYFSRLFAQTTGVSPTGFRQRNLE